MIVEEEEKEQPKKGPNWIGILIMLLLLAGPQIITPIAHVVSQLTGGYINLRTIGTLPLLIGLIAVIAVVTSVIKAIVRALRTSSETSSPADASLSKIATSSPPLNTTASPSPSSPATLDRIDELIARYSGGATTATGDLPRLSRWDDDDEDAYPPRSMSAGTSAGARMESGMGTTDGATWRGTQRLPEPPRFEPLISGKVLAFGILGSVLIGGAFLIGGAINSILPLVVGP